MKTDLVGIAFGLFFLVIAGLFVRDIVRGLRRGVIALPLRGGATVQAARKVEPVGYWVLVILNGAICWVSASVGALVFWQSIPHGR